MPLLLLLHILAAIVITIVVMAPLAFGMAAAIAFVEDRRKQRALRRVTAEVRDATKGAS